MKNKEKKIIILLFILLLLVVSVYFCIMKKNENKPDKNIKKYYCKMETNWESFDFKGVNEEDLGQYKTTYSISFDIKEGKELTNFETQEKYEFTNFLGLDSLERERNKDFNEEIDAKQLTKTYTSKTFVPVNFEDYVNNDDPLNDYIKDIEVLGYTCKEI